MPDAERRRFMSTVADLQAAAMRGGSDREGGRSSRSTPRAEPKPARPKEAVSGQAEHTGEKQPQCTKEGKLILAAFEKANASIYTTAQNRPECSGMGTTLVTVMFHDNRITFGHVGDSRLYRLRGDEFNQITVDHSLLQYLVTQGFYTPEEAARSGKKNYLIRAMGNESDVQLDIQQAQARPGDVYLLCSDGLTDLLDDQSVQALLPKGSGNLYDSAKRLVTAANERGGYDNISVILVRVKQTFPGSSAALGDATLERALEMTGITDVGMKRSHNEDSFQIDPSLGVAIIADGMGGYNAGEVASAIAVNVIMDELRRSLSGEIQAPASPSSTRGKDRSESGDSSVEMSSERTTREMENTPSGTEILPAIEDLDIGSWVEFRHSGKEIKRARLSWISPSSGALLFTDRHGTKVAEASPRGLSVQMTRGEAHVLEKAPLFDRAVGKVMRHVRSAGESQ